MKVLMNSRQPFPPVARATPLVCAVLAALPLFVACPKPDALALRALTSEQATARVLNVARRHERMGGLVKARLPGIEGMVASVDLDVALEPPARVSVAVRSFFDQPMQVLVTDGREVTVFDATQGVPLFLRGPANERTLQRVLPLPLRPEELVQVMLARPPLDARGRLVSVDEDAGTYTVHLEAFGHGPVDVTARVQDDAIMVWRQHRKDGRALLEARYSDHRMVGDVALAHRFVLTRLDTPTHEAVEILATDLDYNGPPFEDVAFQLIPPPGVPVGTL